MKKSLFIVLLLSISILSYSLNFSVAPTGFSVELDKASTQEVTIINNTSEPLRLDAAFGADSEFGEKYNLNSNLNIFPKTISLKPAGKQTIRFKVKPDSKMENGEYKSLLTLTEVPGEVKTVVTDPNATKEMSSNLKFITEISVSIYGYKGDLVTKGTLSDVKLNYTGNSAVLSASSFSEGNNSLKFLYSLKVLNTDIESVGLFGISAREGKKDLSLSTDLAPDLKGKKAKIVITDQNGKIYYDDVQTL